MLRRELGKKRSMKWRFFAAEISRGGGRLEKVGSRNFGDFPEPLGIF